MKIRVVDMEFNYSRVMIGDKLVEERGGNY